MTAPSRYTWPIEILSYQHGIYPRSERVVAETRGFERGRVGAGPVDAAFAQDLANLVRVQRDAGLDFFSDGLLRWQDIFRRLLEAIGPVRPEPLVRWFDTNTFFREPDLLGGVGAMARPDGVLPDPSVPQPRVLTLPSPYLFSRAARTDVDRNRLMVDLAGRVLRPTIDAALTAGCELIHLEEPWLAYFGIEQRDWAPLGEALDILHRDLEATLAFHVYFGDAAPHLDQLRRLPVDAIGVDFVETDIGALGSRWDLGLVAGLISGRNSTVETLESTVAAARRIAETVRPRNLYLSSTCELQYLPTVVAEHKVKRLGEAARAVRELASV